MVCRAETLFLIPNARCVCCHPAHCGCPPWLLLPGAFENTVIALYKYVVPKPKSECTKVEQLGVSFLAGYIAGVFCAAVSHPADNLVSKLNAKKGATAGDIIKEMGWYQLATRGLGLRIIMVGECDVGKG